jgi:hypothetical protein
MTRSTADLLVALLGAAETARQAASELGNDGHMLEMMVDEQMASVNTALQDGWRNMARISQLCVKFKVVQSRTEEIPRKSTA